MGGCCKIETRIKKVRKISDWAETNLTPCSAARWLIHYLVLVTRWH